MQGWLPDAGIGTGEHRSAGAGRAGPGKGGLGKPIYVNSGYRCPRHNAAVGGVPNSQHMRGEAADIRLAEIADNAEIVSAVKENGKWDQMIVYPTFVHVSWKRTGQNRKQIIYKH